MRLPGGNVHYQMAIRRERIDRVLFEKIKEKPLRFLLN